MSDDRHPPLQRQLVGMAAQERSAGAVQHAPQSEEGVARMGEAGKETTMNYSAFVFLFLVIGCACACTLALVVIFFLL
jgi:hypothetical protein